MDTNRESTIKVSDDELREFPVETDFLKGPEWDAYGPITCFGVTDESGRLVQGFTPTRAELETLARHYLEESCRIVFEWLMLNRASSQGSRFRIWAGLRLETIGKMLGQQRLEPALKPVGEKWDTFIADATELCRARGVDSLLEVGADDPDLLSLMQKVGFILIPPSTYGNDC